MDKNTRNFTCIGHITQKFRQSLHISNTANYMNSSIKQVDQRQTFPEYRIAKDKLLRASPRAFVFWVSYLKKEKNDKKLISNRFSIYLAFYPRFLFRGCRWLSLPSTSHPILDFGQAVGFHPYFASYFVLHNSYIRILEHLQQLMYPLV